MDLLLLPLVGIWHFITIGGIIGAVLFSVIAFMAENE